jgi:hypothetical protein
MVKEEIEVLRSFLKENTDKNFHQSIEQLCDQAYELEQLKEKCNRQAMILRRLTPENFPNTYFICGEAGEKDINGLPETIMVVPAYGVDWNMTYKRTGKTYGPEW